MHTPGYTKVGDTGARVDKKRRLPFQSVPVPTVGYQRYIFSTLPAQTIGLETVRSFGKQCTARNPEPTRPD